MKKLLVTFLLMMCTFHLLYAQFSSSSFATKVDYTSGGGGSNSVGRTSSADFNGDGLIDVICPNITNNTVSIFKNTSSGGSISFATKVDITTYSGSPECIAVGDFDNDGKIDFAVSHGASSSSVVEVFRNTSSSTTISFSSGTTFTVGYGPKGIVARDFDGDGKIDIATSNYISGTISILRNTTSGSTINFASKVDYTAGSSPILIISNDFDGDGKLDLACSNYVSSGTIKILKNASSSGTISFSSWGTLYAGNLPNFLHSSDIDGDGKPELYVVNYGNYNFEVYKNTGSSGTINFASGVTFTTGSSSTFPQGIIARDFDGDGKNDIVTTNSGGSTISVFRNTASSGTINSATFASAVNYSSVSGNNIGLDTADYDNDGKPDITVSNNSTSTFSIFQNQVTATAPTSGGSTISFSNIGNTSMTVKFDKGNGSNRIVLCKATSSVNSAPVNGTSYTASSTFGNGSQLGTGNYVVYSDTGTSFTLTGLSANTTYNFAVFEYNGIGGYASFLTSAFSYITGSQKTSNTIYYYSKSSGYLDSLSTWGTNTDGSGTSPSSFSSGNSYFYVSNNYSPTISSNLSIGGGNTVLVVGDGVNTFNLSIPTNLSITSDSFILKSNSTLTIYGSLGSTNNTFNDSSTVQFLSSSAQNIPNGSYYNLLVNNSTKKLNNGNIDIRYSLTMMSSINLNSNTITLGNSSSQTGILYYASGTLYGGAFKRWFATSTNSGSSGLFPIGTSSNYRPVQISYTTAPTTAGTISASFDTNTPSNSGLPMYDFATSPIIQITKVGKNGIWGLTATTISGGQFTASITADGFYGVSSYGDLRMVRRANSSSAWSLNGTAQVTTGSNSTPVLSRTGMNAFGEFGVGGDSSVNSLPVKLIILTVRQSKDDAILNWQTASEINSDYFEVQRAIDCKPCNEKSWLSLGRVQASGNSTDIRNYQFSDKNLSTISPKTPNIYYRLKQVDKNGDITYSNIIVIELKKQINTITLFPLPINNILSAVSNNAENINQLIIFDMSGKEVIKSEGNQIDVSMLAQGMYIVKVITDQQTYIQKITK